MHLCGFNEAESECSLAEKLYQTMTKKFSNEVQVWIRYGVFQIQGKLEAARNLLKRSLSKQQRKYYLHVYNVYYMCITCITQLVCI